MRRFRVTVNGLSYEVTVEELDGPAAEAAATAPAISVARPAAPPPPPPRPAPPPPTASTGAGRVGGDGVVKAPLPGAILAVKVAPGDEVRAGQVLVLLEAMKMENEVASPIAGRVRDVRVVPGDAVGLGDVLCVVEA